MGKCDCHGGSGSFLGGLQFSSPLQDENLCDDYQRMAMDKVRGIRNACLYNRYAEYPRLSWRLGREQYDLVGLPRKWIRSTLFLNVSSEQMHSQTVVTFSSAFFFIWF